MRINRIRLITEMAKRDITNLDLAKMSGISRVTVSSVRSGKSCSSETAAKLAAALGVDVEEIISQEV